MNPNAHVNGRSRQEIFRRLLLAWYDVHARDLPWRQDHDAYRVWVSEIMLQQTRVAAVIEHYHEFLRRFPTVEKLAAARESSVLAAWSGLGYYRRARMLHSAAKLVVRNLGGELPPTVAGLRELPGIGRYTSAAIASIAFGEPTAVVDGNVERVLQRFSGERIGSEQAWGLAETMLDRERPGDFNQAMMELGATLCTPRTPSCLTCPVIALCASRGELAGAEKSIPQKKREIHYALDLRDDAVFLVKRPQDARLMAGMWELPELEGSLSPTTKGLRRRSGEDHNGRVQGRGDARAQLRPLFTVRHAITTTDYTVHVWRMTRPHGVAGKRIALERLPRIALTGLARKILRKTQTLPMPRECGPQNITLRPSLT